MIRALFFFVCSIICFKLNLSFAITKNKNKIYTFIISKNKWDSKITKPKSFRSVKNFKIHLWGYPIYDDSPYKLRRPKIYSNFEYGELRKCQDFDYVISTNISQNNYKVPEVGYLFKVDEMGTGRTDDTYTPIELVFGQKDIDMKEVEKIKKVLNIFDQGNGLGICTLMGAKKSHFAFKYNGYLNNFYGIKNYLRFLINKHYPGAKVTMISEHWIDSIDRHISIRHSNIPFSKIGHQRRLIFSKYDYIYENDKNKRVYKGENKSNVWSFYNDPQMLT